MRKCDRCLEPVPAKAARCHHCGERLSSDRHYALLFASVGVCALVFVVGLMLLAARNWDLENRTDSGGPAPQQTERPLGN